MKFSVAAITLALATAVVAAPSYNKHDPQENTNICGQAKISCCNKEIRRENKHESKNAGGLLGTLLNELNIDTISIFDQCSELPIQIPVIGASVSDLLNKECSATAACCQDTKSTAEGLVAVSVPCVPINLLS